MQMQPYLKDQYLAGMWKKGPTSQFTSELIQRICQETENLPI